MTNLDSIEKQRHYFVNKGVAGLSGVPLNWVYLSKSDSGKTACFLLFVKLKKYLFVLLPRVLGAACGIFSCGM